MRILYVATTRAKERLILTGVLSHKRCRDTLLQGLLSADPEIGSGQYGGNSRIPSNGSCIGCAGPDRSARGLSGPSGRRPDPIRT